ncbi:MAG: Unknown protein [uncultured Sulfurovum sp.]|uniref:beta-lactamase n=1 Tax=uncultured Sulfurovum sp. TaxID=269237 RepID=A0A6S6TE20_9BACT|nr:MAG: Unknown protein [uncultured Sulfurovum sp.]
MKVKSVNQTKKRLTIIKLAISMTDTETIELQIDKLALLKDDTAIDEILTSLYAKNYAHAQMLISTYIDTPTNNIAQRITTTEDDHSQQTIEPLPNTTKAEEKVENKQNVNTPVNYDALLNIDVNKVLENSIHLKTSHLEQDTLSHEKPKLKTDLIQRDTFFDDIEESTNETVTPSIKKEELKETIQDKPSKPVLQTDLIKKDTFFNDIQENTDEIITPSIRKEKLKETIQEKASKPVLQTDLIEKDTFFNDIQKSTDKIITPFIKKEELKETVQEKPSKPVLQTDLIEKDTFFNELEISQVPTSSHIKAKPIVEEIKPLEEEFQIDITPLIYQHKKAIEKVTQNEKNKPITTDHKDTIDTPSNKDTIRTTTKTKETVKIDKNTTTVVSAFTQSSPQRVDLKTTNEESRHIKPRQRSIASLHSSDYPPIKNIEQKLEHMNLRYPTEFASNEEYPSVQVWIETISTTGYSESDVENVILQIKELSQYNQAEAGQLLLITASTESQYAEFILARELYKGGIIQKNLIEAFNRINHLAIEKEYPEAICDLAQFYEKGIGTSVDTNLAKTLYEKAMELGITRAEGHVERLNKKQKGFFSRLIH